MFSALPLLRADRSDGGSGISRFVERLESRCLLSAVAAPTVPLSIVGPAFTGSANLTIQTTPTLPEHSAAIPMQLSFTSLAGATLTGIETGISAGPLNFTALISHQSFDGVFADGGGSITGTFSPDDTIVTGTVQHTAAGQLSSGDYSVAVAGTLQGTVLNFFAVGTGSAGPVQANSLATTITPPTSTTAPAATPAAGTTSATSDFLVSPDTTTGDLNLNNTIPGDHIIPGLAPNLLILTSSLSVFGPPGAAFISNTGPTFTTSSTFMSIDNSTSSSSTIGAVLAIGPVGG